MSELRSLLDQLAALDPADLDPDGTEIHIRAQQEHPLRL